MSNHTGSYILNYALRRLHETDFINLVGREKARQFVMDVIQWSCRQYDCNEPEILDELGAVFGICSYCLQPADEIIEDWCLKCRAELLTPEELTPAERRSLKKTQATKTLTERQ